MAVSEGTHAGPPTTTEQVSVCMCVQHHLLMHTAAHAVTHTQTQLSTSVSLPTLSTTQRALPLAGCKACITQFNSVEERSRLPEQLRAAGATYTADLYKDCTHLLAKAATGDKYK